MCTYVLASRPHLEINEYKTENDILLDLRLCFRFVLHLFAWCTIQNPTLSGQFWTWLDSMCCCSLAPIFHVSSLDNYLKRIPRDNYSLKVDDAFLRFGLVYFIRFPNVTLHIQIIHFQSKYLIVWKSKHKNNKLSWYFFKSNAWERKRGEILTKFHT